MKRIIFNWIFSETEKTAIINALWKRSKDVSNVIGENAVLQCKEKSMKAECERLAIKLMR